MKAASFVAFGILAFAAGTAMAGEASAKSEPLTRAEVVRSVLDARAAGQLLPAGEAAGNGFPRSDRTTTVSRSDVKHDVIVARAAGQLLPAGEASDERIARVAFSSDVHLTRAEVKAETLRARASGELIRAGDAYGSGDVQQAHAATPNAFAFARPAWFAARSAR